MDRAGPCRPGYSFRKCPKTSSTFTIDWPSPARGTARSSNPPAGDVEALTVSQLTAAIEKAIKSGVPGTVTVRGEASNVSNRQASGHLYFTLKDSAACINCVMWRDSASRLQFKLEDGLEMIATGRVAVYAPQGRYQLQVQHLQPAGRGRWNWRFGSCKPSLPPRGFSPRNAKSRSRFIRCELCC